MAAEKDASPVGEDNWVAYIAEAARTADDLEKRVAVIELYKRAVSAEPGSVKIWLAYCEFFHSLHVACAGPSPPPSWTPDEVAMGREIFSLGQDLDLWQSAYEDIRLRIGDSHVLWDRWIEVEMEQLARTGTREGVERITLLYRDRLRTPHLTWDETSQRFSSFLSEYNRNIWEATMKEVTESAQEAKAVVDARQRFEYPLQKAAREGNVEEESRVMKEYLAWEIAQGRRKGDTSAVPRCQSLFARALAGVFTKDGSTWLDYIAYLSSNLPAAQTVASLLSPLQRAVDHCPWSGPLWSRYILAAEEAGLSFDDMENIKHSATNDPQLYRDGLASLLEMYVAWCSYLRRIAMDPDASEDAVDVADVGLPAALESVEVLGKRLYGAEYQGDPEFRLERIYIHYLTEKKAAVDDARAQWELLSRKPLYADKYDFWRAYYLWEMQAFRMTGQPRSRSASGSSASGAAVATRTPENATAVLGRAVNRKTLDWPERAIAVYLQHCNDHDLPHTIRRVRDNVHKVRIGVAKRREREAQEAAAAYAYQAQVQVEEAGAEVQAPEAEAPAPESPAGTKRKRADTLDEDETASKRPKGADTNGGAQGPVKGSESDWLKRDREHTSVLMTNLPADTTQTALKKYLKDFGRIQNIALIREEDSKSSTALVEFEDILDAEDCVQFRDNKYFGESQIRVKSGAGLTLFVTNYPPAANDGYIRELFKDSGDVLSIRWPSLKYNTRRRFCYVSFRDREAAARATRLDGRLLEDRFRLEVKVSDPARRKKRNDAVSQKREVFVGNLDPVLREADVADVFGKYGSVARINFVGGSGGRAGESRGGVPSAFVEYETADQAERAVAELHNTKLRSRIVVVSLAKPKTKVSAKMVNPDAPSGDGVPPPPPPKPEADTPMEEGVSHKQAQAAGGPSPPPQATVAPVPRGPPVPARLYENPAIKRKVAVMNLPDTVNEARVAELAREVGEVEKLVLQPGKGSAVVTFAEEAAAGRAMMALDGREWEGRRLRTGGMEEMGRYTGRDPAQGRGGPEEEGGKEEEKGRRGGGLAPVNVRRPVLGRGGKRGLARPVGAGPKEQGGKEGKEEANEGGQGKSNADFKAMFLGGK